MYALCWLDPSSLRWVQYLLENCQTEFACPYHGPDQLGIGIKVLDSNAKGFGYLINELLATPADLIYASKPLRDSIVLKCDCNTRFLVVRLAAKMGDPLFDLSLKVCFGLFDHPIHNGIHKLVTKALCGHSSTIHLIFHVEFDHDFTTSTGSNKKRSERERLSPVAIPRIDYKRGTACYTEKEQKYSDGHKQAKWVTANEEVVRGWREKHENPDRIHKK